MKRNTAILISGFPLFIVSALRYGIGTDYFSYCDMFNGSFRRGHRGDIEPLFFYLNKGLADLNFDVQWLFVICSAIIVYFVFRFIFENSTDEAFSIFLFVGLTYYMSSFNVMRQFLAIAICVFAINYVKKERFFSFCLCILLAMGFHYTSIIFLFIYLFKYKSITPRLAIILSGVFMVLIPTITEIAIDLMGQTKYADHISLNTFSANSLVGIMVQLSILLFATVFYDKTDNLYKLLYSIQVVALWLTMLGNYIPLIGRIKWYFGICAIVLIPLVISKIKNTKEKIIWRTIISMVVFIYAEMIVGVEGAYGCLPYESVV